MAEHDLTYAYLNLQGYETRYDVLSRILRPPSVCVSSFARSPYHPSQLPHSDIQHSRGSCLPCTVCKVLTGCCSRVRV